MCLGIPGQIVEMRRPASTTSARCDVSGVRRNVNVGLLAEGPGRGRVGDWVLIHVGFAMSKIDEEEAAETREFLETLGAPFEEELDELKGAASSERHRADRRRAG